MKKIIKVCIVSVICLLVILLGINIYVIFRVNNKIVNEVSNIDYILVLGASVRGKTASPMLKDRLDKAYLVYKETGATIILSGDAINSDEYDEVGVMRDYLLDLGVSSSDIVLDSYGISTYDSIYRIKDIVKDKRVVIITQKYHLYRALYISKSFNINAYGIYSSGNNYKNQEYRELREFFARIKDYFKCIVKPSSEYNYEIEIN